MQKNARDKDTFAPHVISLRRDEYESMVRTMRLPFRAIEGTSLVGPFFWSAFDQDKEDPHLRTFEHLRRRRRSNWAGGRLPGAGRLTCYV